jgi:hypothetical protein
MQLESLKDSHQRDLDRDYDGVFLVNALEEKYKRAAREFSWFPSRNGPFPQSRRQSAGLFVRRTMCTSPHNPARGGQALDFLDLAKNCSFLIWKLRECPFSIYGWTLAGNGFFLRNS